MAHLRRVLPLRFARLDLRCTPSCQLPAANKRRAINCTSLNNRLRLRGRAVSATVRYASRCYFSYECHSERVLHPRPSKFRKKPGCRPGQRNVSSFPAVVPHFPRYRPLSILGTGLAIIRLLTRIVLSIRTQCPGFCRCASTDTRWSPCTPSGQSWPVDC
jgi:hypothetical protein